MTGSDRPARGTAVSGGRVADGLRAGSTAVPRPAGGRRGPMNIVVLVKQVPDTYSERKLRDDGVLDRDATDAVLDEINERAVEAALQLKEANDGSEVTVLTMGPDRATDAIRQALSMGADKAVHLSDE